MSRRLHAFVFRDEPVSSSSASTSESGVRPSTPHPPPVEMGESGGGFSIESDLPPPFVPRAVDREAGRYFSSNAPSGTVHVLVVEDDELLRGSMQDIATEAGHAAVSATNLTEARVYLAVAMPDVMVLDLNLDGEFGGDLLAELATLSSAPATVLVSAYPFAGLVAERYGLELVRKPFGVAELEAAITRAHQQRRRPRMKKPVIASG